MQRRWVSPEAFAELLALCQLVPGPASSQLGVMIGFTRAGWRGAAAAWLGFTLPSALVMVLGATLFRQTAMSTADLRPWLHGLQLVAVPVVAQALWSMGRSLCPDIPRVAIAAVAAALLLLLPSSTAQSLALAVGGLLGLIVCRAVPLRALSAPRLARLSISALGLTVFALLLGAAFWISALHLRGMLGLSALFYRSGALVFGGGHVVLPLLQGALIPSGWMSDQAFLSGYGAAQALPGPLFTLAAYLGAMAAPQSASPGVVILWSVVALVAIFLPGMLIALCAWSLRD